MTQNISISSRPIFEKARQAGRTLRQAKPKLDIGQVTQAAQAWCFANGILVDGPECNDFMWAYNHNEG